jgi:hypothetical protein
MFLTSCGTAVKQLDIFTKEVERQPLNLDKPLAPKLEDIKWIIINSENAEEVFAKMSENKTDPVIFGLSDEDYELLSKNFAQIRAYMIQQNAIIEEYKKYYESEENSNK